MEASRPLPATPPPRTRYAYRIVASVAVVHADLWLNANSALEGNEHVGQAAWLDLVGPFSKVLRRRSNRARCGF